MRRFLIAVLLMMMTVVTGHAGEGDPLPAEEAFKLSVGQGQNGSVELRWTIAEGYYLYRDHMEASNQDDGRPVALSLTAGVKKEDPNFGSTEVYHDAATAALQPSYPGKVKIRYQGCKEDSICYPPIDKILDTQALSIASPGKTVAVGQQLAAGESQTAFKLAEDSTDSLIPSLLKSGGPAFVVASFLVFGLLLSFTPCVLPMYPILAATLAREGEHLTARRGFALSLSYVVAMAAAFGLLGVFAAWSGQNLQIVLQSPAAIIVVSLIFLALAVSMFGAFELQLPSRWVRRISTVQGGERGSAGGAAFLGFTSALIVGPCVTAPLAAALLYIAQTGNAAVGAAALFALGFGQGIPLIAFGTMGAKALPRAGAWMEHVKHVFGFVFLAAAAYMVNRVLPGSFGMALWAVLLIAAGVFLGGFDTMTPQASPLRRLLKASGLISFLTGVLMGIGAASGGTDPLQPLQFVTRDSGGNAEKTVQFDEATSAENLQASLGKAASAGMPTAVYFTAEWCVACHHIDRSVLRSDEVVRGLVNYNVLKVDLTDVDGPREKLMQALGVAGPPTMIFFDRKSAEIPGSRLVGEFDAASLMASAKLGE